MLSYCIVVAPAWQEGVFMNLYQLEKLLLWQNVISSIEPRVFDESANLSSLSIIDVSSNMLTELEPWPLIRAQHRPMRVWLQHNYITRSVLRASTLLNWIIIKSDYLCPPKR